MDLKQYAASQFIKVDDLFERGRSEKRSHTSRSANSRSRCYVHRPLAAVTERHKLRLPPTLWGSADSDDLIGKEIEFGRRSRFREAKDNRAGARVTTTESA